MAARSDNGNDPTGQPSTAVGGTGDTTNTAPPHSPMATGDGAAHAPSPENVLAMSSGTSDGASSQQELASPFVTPPQQQPDKRKRRPGEAPGSRSGTPRSSRAPSPAGSTAESSQGSEAPPFKRPLHRRVESGADSFPSRLARLEEQHEADREVITWLGDHLKLLHDKVTTHDAALNKTRRAAESANRNLMGVETAVLKRVDESRAFMDKKIDNKIQETMKIVESEITDKRLMTRHLLGHKEPVLEPLVHEIMGTKFEAIEAQLNKLGEWVNGRQERDDRVEGYLQNLHKERPEEGKVVKDTFLQFAQEIVYLRATADASGVRGGMGLPAEEAAAETPVMSSSAPSPPPDMPASGNVQWQLNNLTAQIQYIKTNILQDKCHCIHVDLHQGKLTEVDRKLNWLDTEVRRVTSETGFVGAAAAAPTTDEYGCQGCGPWSQFVPSGAPRKGPCGGGDGGGGDHWGNGYVPNAWKAAFGGHGKCHCVHLIELAAVVSGLKNKVEEVSNGRDGGDPWSDPTIGAHCGGGRAPRARPQPLPLTLGPMGQLTAPDSRLFDDRLTNQATFCFDGQKGGVAWKGKLERYFISKCPALMNMLKWAEKYEGEVIDDALLKEAVAGTAMYTELLHNLNSSLWGFLSNCVSAEAETIFKTADTLQGFDAWRRLVRYIEHGKEIRLEAMRTEMKTLHLKPIKSLETVPIGIAEYDLKMKEYAEAGGTVPSEGEMKNDLLNLLPESLRDNLLWRATDPGPYTRFRDMVRSQAARTLLTRKRLPLHNLDEEIREQLRGPGIDDGEVEEEPNISSLEDFIAAIKNGKFNSKQPRGQRPNRDLPPRRPRQCANCGKEYKEIKCPYPDVPKADRVCWWCGEKGHQARHCPESKNGKANRVNAVEDGSEGGLRRLAVVEYADGFIKPKKTVKPMPVRATLQDFISTNSFAALKQSQKQKKSRGRRPPNQETSIVDDFTPELEDIINVIEDGHAVNCNADGKISYYKATDMSNGFIRNTGDGFISDPDIEQLAKFIEENEEKVDKVQEERDDMQEVDATPGSPSWIYSGEARPAAPLPSSRPLAVITYAEETPLLTMAPQEVRIKAAADTGAVDNVIGVEDLPRGAVPSGNKDGKHFVGAGGDTIERFGDVDTLIKSAHGEMACGWQVADVTRALHSISKVTGPKELEQGHHEVLFTNKKGVVVPPGFVEEILKKVKPILQYEREGGLYLADITLSSFTRQGQKS